MYYYKAYELSIESDIKIPQLIELDIQTCDIKISLSKVDHKIKEFVDLGHDFGKKPNGFWFKNKYGYFQIENGDTIIIEPYNEFVDEIVPFVLGYCMATLFEQRGFVAIHGSSVAKDGLGYIIAGDSGSGKSTLTNRLLENEYRLLADDVSMVSGDGYIYPGFPTQNICDNLLVENHGFDIIMKIEEERDKYLIDRKKDFYDKPVKLQYVIVLNISEDQSLDIYPIKDYDRLNELCQYMFMDRTNRLSGMSNQLILTALRISQSIKMYKIKRPENGDSTMAQLGLVEGLVGNARGEDCE